MKNEEQSAYISLGQTSQERQLALRQMSESYAGYGAVANNQRTFTNILPSTTVRSEYNRGDYEYFRPNEMLPRTPLEKIAASLRSYDDFGIVRNVIDLMGDFASQGVRIVHPNKKIQKFLNSWFSSVHGKERSNAFLNLLYRCGNVVVRRLEGKISIGTSREMSSAADGIPSFDNKKQERRKIPLRYIFYTPLAIELIGGDLASFCDKKIYALKLSSVVAQIRGQGFVDKSKIQALINDLPVEIQQALKTGAKYVPFKDNEVNVYHYKKDDWSAWATPMLAPILKDLYMLDKLKLADLTAMDGIISSVRLWNVGHLDGVNSIMPTKTILDKLRSELSNNSAGGVLDLVWGPELSFKESSSNSHEFLGEEKYKPILEAIYTGLGLPQSLVGSGGTGFTNNYMSLKTLVERLEYGREILVDFWNQELKIIQKAMGHKQAGTVIFDEMVLSDEAAQSTLLLQMVDRNILSDETVRDRLKIHNEIEEVRIRRESKDKGSKLPPKAGQFHNPQTDEDLKKIALQGGIATPSEVGIDLKPRKKGEKTRNEQQMEMQQKLAETKQKGSDLNGRPINSKDSVKRKQKKVLPKAKASFDFASLSLWANSEYKNVSEIISKAVLDGLDKKNLRMLTTAEFQGLEKVKFIAFSNLEPFQQVTPEKVYSLLETYTQAQSDIKQTYYNLVSEFVNKTQKEPNTEESRSLQISAYILKHNIEKDDKDGDN